MPSFLKFADYLQNEKNLDSFQKEQLHKIIFQSYQDSYINAEELSSKIQNLSLGVSYHIIKSLILNEIVEGRFDCPSCDSTFALKELLENNFNNKCPECGHDIHSFNELFIKIYGNIPFQDYEKLTFIQIIEMKIINLAKSWRENGFITYFLLDLVNSESIQKENEREYNTFLSNFRDFWLKRVLSQSKSNCFFIGEIGDAYKILFQDVQDAFNIVRIFSKELTAFDTFKFNGINLKFPNFPKFKIVIDCIDIPTDKQGKSIDPGEIFIKTANRTYDINSAGITQLYRAEARLKDFKEEYYRNWEIYDIGLWLMSSAFKKLENHVIISDMEENPSGWNLLMLKGEKIEAIPISKY